VSGWIDISIRKRKNSTEQQSKLHERSIRIRTFIFFCFLKVCRFCLLQGSARILAGGLTQRKEATFCQQRGYFLVYGPATPPIPQILGIVSPFPSLLSLSPPSLSLSLSLSLLTFISLLFLFANFLLRFSSYLVSARGLERAIPCSYFSLEPPLFPPPLSLSLPLSFFSH